MKKTIFAISFCTSIITSCGQISSSPNRLTQKDFKEIFQLAIDFPPLQQYYHIESDTSRREIIFQSFDGVNKDNLKGVTKFGRQVNIMTMTELKQNEIKTYFIVKKLTIEPSSLRLELNYVSEGVLVSYLFKKNNNSWAISDSSLEEL